MITTIGRTLIERRRALGLCLDDVAHASRVSRQNLRWLEADELGRFPNAAYALAFLRFYAGVLELDAEALLARARQQLTVLNEARAPLLGGPGAAFAVAGPGHARARARTWERVGSVLSAAALSVILAAAGLTVMAHVSPPGKMGADTPAAESVPVAIPGLPGVGARPLVAETTRGTGWTR